MLGPFPGRPAITAGAPPDDALEALRLDWEGLYMIGCDDERGWWAARRDLIGGYLTTHDPDGLWAAIREDYDLKPVPRDVPPLREHP